MQTKIPYFPMDTKLINNTVGFREQDGTVYYFHNGSPIFCHTKDDHNSYRFILANMVTNGLCSIVELSTALDVNRRNIERYTKAYLEQSAGYFFSRKERRGQCYKMTADKLVTNVSHLSLTYL